MGKFEEAFNESMVFSNGCRVISRFHNKEAAAEIIAHEIGEDITAENLEVGWVRFGFAPENIEDCSGENCWYTCAEHERGSKPVWVCYC